MGAATVKGDDELAVTCREVRANLVRPGVIYQRTCVVCKDFQSELAGNGDVHETGSMVDGSISSKGLERH